jgi:hypothetical protein
MYAAPVQLVPAPGAGLLIVPVAATINYVGGSAAFGVGSGGAIQIQWGNTNHAGGTNAMSATLAAASLTGGVTNNISVLSGSPAGGTVTSAGAINQGLYLTNATGAFTNAGAGATLSIMVDYLIISCA